MSYIDEKDRKIQEQMKAEGKVKISNFNKMVENYFKSKYNIDGCFKFLYVQYEYFDKNHQTYNLDTGQYVSRPENRKVKTMFPFLLEFNSIDDVRNFSLNIPGIIEINNLASEIISRLPEGVKFITDKEIKEILFNAGYEDPFFDHYFYSMMDYPDYNLYAKPIIKNNAINFQMVDSDISQLLEQKYLDGALEQTGIIDTANFPQNIPDDETCELLEDLFSKNQLIPRQVKYCADSMHITDYFDEYNYNGRKFIRYKATIDQSDNITLSNDDTINKNQFYWIEVKPIMKKNIHNDNNIKSCFENESTREKIKDVITTSDKPILIKKGNDNGIVEWLNKSFKCIMKDKNSFYYKSKSSELNEFINLCYDNENEFYMLIINDVDELKLSDLAYIMSIIRDDDFPKNSKTIFLQSSKYNSLAEPLDVIPVSSVTTIDITGEELSITNYEPKIDGKKR